MTYIKKHNFFISALIVFFLLTFSNEIMQSIRDGIRLSAFTVIPAVFPFLVLSDYLSAAGEDFPLDKTLSKLFLIPKCATGALVCGLMCGFPSGVKYSVRLYENNMITKDDLERIIGLVNNPSMAFVVSAVGIGMLKSPSDGLLLLSALLFSVLLTSRCFPSQKKKIEIQGYITGQKFSLVNSIKDAGLSAVALSSYIIFFSSILGVIKKIIKSDVFIAFISAAIEIGNASALISSANINMYCKFLLLGFALGFSGFSVHFQAFSQLPKDIKKNKYIKMKLTQGIICGIVASLLKMALAFMQKTPMYLV